MMFSRPITCTTQVKSRFGSRDFFPRLQSVLFDGFTAPFEGGAMASWLVRRTNLTTPFDKVEIGFAVTLEALPHHSTNLFVCYYNSQALPFKKRGLSQDVQLLAELAHVKHEAVHTPHSIFPFTLK